MIVEISTHGSSLKRDHDCFIIQNINERTEIPAEKIDAINITANVLISTQAIRLCIEKNIQLVISDYYGRPFSRLWSSTPGRSTELRRKQYLNQNTDFALKFSKEIVTIKLTRQKHYLIYLKNNRKNPSNELITAIYTLDSSLMKIKNILKESTIDLTSKSSMLGLEGSSAALYFRALSSVLPKKWWFKERTQHPAYDAFNTTLNYLYGMGYSTVEKIIILSGLDPNAGFYHADLYGKPTLSFDLMELIRPMIDRTVVSLFTKRKVHDYWFENQNNRNNEIMISREGRKNLISEYVKNNQKNIESEIWRYCKILTNKLVLI